MYVSILNLLNPAVVPSDMILSLIRCCIFDCAALGVMPSMAMMASFTERRTPDSSTRIVLPMSVAPTSVLTKLHSDESEDEFSLIICIEIWGVGVDRDSLALGIL